MLTLTTKNVKNFWKRVDKNGPIPDQAKEFYKGLGQCWLWVGHIKKDSGYGIMANKRRPARVHRISYLIAKGEIPEGMEILHKCDVRNCVNPDHLWAGTYQENMDDMFRKGRGPYEKQKMEWWTPGENKCRKYTKLQIMAIRCLVANGFTLFNMKELFGVSSAHTVSITKRRTWKYVPQPSMPICSHSF